MEQQNKKTAYGTSLRPPCSPSSSHAESATVLTTFFRLERGASTVESGQVSCPHRAPGASAIIIIILVVQDLARTRLGRASVTRGRESCGESHSAWPRRLPFDGVFDSASPSDRMTQVLGH
jgi:hypothetical protein